MLSLLDYVVTRDGEILAKLVYAEDCAALVAALGNGTVVHYRSLRGSVLWREGEEEISAADSYDEAGDLIGARAMHAAWGGEGRGT